MRNELKISIKVVTLEAMLPSGFTLRTNGFFYSNTYKTSSEKNDTYLSNLESFSLFA